VLLGRTLEDSKLVAAQARDRFRLSDLAAQPLGHGPEQLVADRMPERVVDVLEVIEIEVKTDSCCPRSSCRRAWLSR